MKQFLAAKIRLTIWYTTIIMMVSLFFTGAYYLRTISMIQFQYEQIELRFQNNNQPIGNPNHVPRRLQVLDEDFIEVQRFLKNQFIIINTLVFVLSASASYFLAGKTLKPIQISLLKQRRFVSDAAHELKTPLTSMRASLEVQLLDKKLPKEARNILQANLEDLKSLISLSENLLSLARTDEGSFEFGTAKFRVNKIANRAVRHISSLAKKKEISIQLNIEKNLEMSSNENALVEVLLVLLDNAVKYSSAKTKIVVEANKDNKNVFITVKDQGNGISNEDLPYIFDRFYRVDQSRTNQEKSGHGLGLSVAQAIVQQQGGHHFIHRQLDLE